MTPRLSVVLAVHRGEPRLPAVLAALQAQCGDSVELLLCFPKGSVGVRGIAARNPWVTAIEADPDALTPQLWREGIDRARGDRVALSSVHLTPSTGWIQALLEVDLERHAAAGGAIENDPAGGALDWAIYIQRYARYGGPFDQHETLDLPGDNAVYDRRALLRQRVSWAHGFWEPAVHARLHAAGARLVLTPEIVAIHHNAYSFAEFAQMRFAHGRRYGFDRARGMSPALRIAYLIAAPAGPLVFGAKLLRNALRRSVTRSRLPVALPALLAFLLAWGGGEVRGALDAVVRDASGPSATAETDDG